MKPTHKNEHGEPNAQACEARYYRTADYKRRAMERERFLWLLIENGGRVRPAMERMGWTTFQSVTSRLQVPEFKERYAAIRALRKSGWAQKRAENVARHNIQRAFDRMFWRMMLGKSVLR